MDEDSGYDSDDALLELDGVTKYFGQESGLLAGLEFEPNQFPPVNINRETVKAVDDVSLEIQPGETLGLVGESGCGKSTLGRTILRLLEPTDGDIYFKGENLADLGGEELRRMRSDMQMIFQDPQSSLDPRMKVGQIIEEPMRAHDMLDDEGRRARAKELLEKVGSIRATTTGIHTRSPAASDSGSTSHGRCRSTPISSSVTSRSPHWTSRSRRKC